LTFEQIQILGEYEEPVSLEAGDLLQDADFLEALRKAAYRWICDANARRDPLSVHAALRIELHQELLRYLCSLSAV
jgi:hypothetical protein